MSPIQNLYSSIKKPGSFALVVLLILIISTLTLLPKLSSKVFPKEQSKMLKTFISLVVKNQSINPQEYWEFREFYSPGFFTFSKTGIDNYTEDKILIESKVTIGDSSSLPLLSF